MTSPAILERFRAKLEGFRGTDRIAAELAIPRLKEEIVAAEEEMRALAYQLCKSDYPGMHEAMKKLTEWKEQPWRIRSGHVPVEECIEARQRIILALSAEEIDELSERYLNRWRLFGTKRSDVAALESLIRLKKQVEQSRPQMKRYRREPAADD